MQWDSCAEREQLKLVQSAVAFHGMERRLLAVRVYLLGQESY